MKSQINLIAFSIFVTLVILISLYFFFSSVTLFSESKAKTDLYSYANVVYKNVMSVKCLGDFYHPIGHVNSTKLNYFLFKYKNAFLPCLDNPKYGYSIEILCKSSKYYLGPQFPDESHCIRKIFPGELEEEQCDISVIVCSDAYSRFLAFVYDSCNNWKSSWTVHKPFMFSKIVSIDTSNNNICETSICNRVYCKKQVIWNSTIYYGLFDVFAIHNSASKVIIV